MSLMPGTLSVKVAVGEYSFAVDGGAVGTITLRGKNGQSNEIPSGAIVLGGFIEVDTAVTGGGSATLSAGCQAAGDLSAAAVVTGAPWSTTGRKSITPAFTGATSLKTTATRSLSVVVGTAALTAGVFRVVVVYI